MSSPWKLALFILAAMLLETHSKPLESTDEGLNEMEKDLASLSVLSDDQKQNTEDTGDEDKIPESLLAELKSRDEKSHETKLTDKAGPPGTATDEDSTKTIDMKALQGFAPGPPGTAKDEDSTETIDMKALQGFAPGTATDEDSKRTIQNEGVLLSKADIEDKQKRLFEILSRDEEEDKDKIPEDLLKDLLEGKSRKDQPKKQKNTWLEPTDKNDEAKKKIMTAILMDEIVNEILERNKRGERIPDKVLDLLRKYNAKRSG